MKNIDKKTVISISITLILLIIMLLRGLGYLQGNNGAIQGKVIKFDAQNSTSNPSVTNSSNANRYAYLDVKILNGDLKGKIVKVQNIVDEKTGGENTVKVGDQVFLNIEMDKNHNIKNAYIYEIIRYKQIYVLAFVFAALILIVGGMKGLKSLLTLVLTGFAVLEILIPMILGGFDPIIISVIICIGVIIVNLMIISGKNKKTLAAIIGTSGGLLIAGAIALSMTSTMMVKGLPDEEVQMLIYLSHNANFDFRGLLFAGILLGALGAVMDVSISIASSMNELIIVKPEITTVNLIKSGMNVGRDIMGSMANTLILAYAGGSMYVLLLVASYGMSISEIINQDIIASELLTALAGSVGLICTIPLTALAVGLLRKFNTNRKEIFE